MLRRFGWIILCLCMCLGISACAHKPKDQLYQQLGGQDGISQIVHQLILEIAKDPVIKPRFKGVNMTKFKTGLTYYICDITGGPCQYQNDSLETIHAGHNYTHSEFNALVSDLVKAMETQKVPVTVQNQLLKLLADSYKEIVYL